MYVATCPTVTNKQWEDTGGHNNISAVRKGLSNRGSRDCLVQSLHRLVMAKEWLSLWNYFPSDIAYVACIVNKGVCTEG